MTSLNIEWLFLKIYDFFTGGFHLELTSAKRVLIFILSLVSIFFIAISIYSFLRIKEREGIESKKAAERIQDFRNQKEHVRENRQWQKVVELINSKNSSDWRLAVMEADSILEDLTHEIGLSGEDLGERLKNAPAGQFKTIDNAWEAHKIRNRIAHDGMSYDLPYKDAKRAVELFESVFNEFDFI